MPLFSIKRDKLEEIDRISFKLEKDIQNVTSKNLDKIFGLEFVRNEYKLNNLRIDTLAFNKDTNSFVIIEYKKDRNFSVIDQGYAYLSLLLNNKADFILEYNERKEDILRRDDVDWSQSRVIFISPQFTKYQRQAIDFKDLPIELWEISKYNNNTILFNQLKSPETSESITTVSKESKVVQEVSREVKVYEEDDHLEGISDGIQELYGELKRRILKLDENIEIRPRKLYIGFISRTNFVDIHLYKGNLKLWLNLRKGNLDDPKKIARDVSNIGHWGNGEYEISLEYDGEIDLDYLMMLIRQSFTQNS